MLNETINSQPKVRMSKVLLVLCLSAAMLAAQLPVSAFAAENVEQEFPPEENSEPVEDTESVTEENEESAGEDTESETEENEESAGEVSNWNGLQEQFNNASTDKNDPTQITLSGNVTAGGGDNSLEIPGDRYVTLDLNGHTINANNQFRVLVVNGGLTLTDSSTGKSGKLTGGKTSEGGGGVYVNGGGKFTLNGGTISGCTTVGDRYDANGGGVYVKSGGIFTMNGGTISGCEANGTCDFSGGGGVYVDSGGEFTMKGGTIDSCNAEFSGGGVLIGGVTIEGVSKFTMDGGTINGCTATNYGGGVQVFLNGEFSMESGTISDCNAEFGGGVFVFQNNKFTMNGGTISGCSAEYGGGGVYVDGEFTMSGGTIERCSAEDGGGVNVSLCGKFIMESGTISGCNAASKGGGVYVFESIEGVGTFIISGRPVIRDNRKGEDANNVELEGSTIISVNGALTNGAEIHVTAGNGAAIARGNGGYTLQASDADAFHSDNAVFSLELDNGEIKPVIVWKTLQTKFNNASTDKNYPTRITLTNDVTAGEGDSALVIPEGKYVTLDLSGNTIDAKSKFTVISVNGSLTLKDSSSTKTGKLTGGKATNGGGVYVNGTFTMEGGTITNCTATNSNIGGGGGVYVNGTFTMAGGTISGCKASDWCGGGVYVYDGNFTMENGSMITGCNALLGGGGVVVEGGRSVMNGGTIDRCSAGFGGGVSVGGGDLSVRNGTFTIKGGTIRDCSADIGGGGVYVGNDTFSMQGGTISGCDANEGGGGVYVAEDGMFQVSGAPGISGNRKGVSANNVLFESGETITTITVTGELTDGAEIYINADKDTTVAKIGDPRTTPLTKTEAGYFKSDIDPKLSGGLNEEGQVVFVEAISCDHTNKRLVEGTTIEGTCINPGYQGDYFCPDCGITLKGKETPVNPDNHDFIMVEVVKPATTLTKGETKYRCSRCHAEKIVADIPCVEEEGRDYDDLRKDVEDLSGNAAPVIENGKDENGNDTETVKIGGEEVSKTVTDKDTGKETIVSKVWIGGLKDSYFYTGSAIKPAFHVYDGTIQLKEKTDYTVSYKNNKDAGSATVEIKFKGNYKDTKAETLSFTISKAELGKDIIAHEVGAVEKKSAQKPVPVLTRADTGMTVNSKCFDFSYSPDPVKAAGEYTVTITPKNGGGSKNYGGSTTAKIVVTTKDKVLSNAKVSFDKKSYAYTGSAVTPKYSLKLDGRTLTENTDYKRIDICNNTAPGTATVIFEGTGSYVGTKSATFKISGKIELKDSSDFTFSYDASVPFVKGGAKPGLSVRDNRNNVNLKEGRDYTVSYSKNKSITGTPTITIKGKGNYKGTVSRSFAITQQDISKLNITAADQFVKKTKLKKATVTIYDTDGNKLSSGKDFIVGANGTPAGDENTGTVTVDVTGAGNYTGQAPAVFRYLDVSVNIGKAGTKKIADQSYTGNAVKLSYADLTNVLYTGSKSAPKYLTPGTDFEIVSYSNNIKRGTAKVVLKGKGSYAGTKTLTFKIVQRKVDYTGKL